MPGVWYVCFSAVGVFGDEPACGWVVVSGIQVIKLRALIVNASGLVDLILQGWLLQFFGLPEVTIGVHPNAGEVLIQEAPGAVPYVFGVDIKFLIVSTVPLR